MKRHITAGVTQLELMVSLILMGLIAIILANALDFNRQSLERTRLVNSEIQKLLNQQKVRARLEGIPLDYAGQTSPEFFEGRQNALRFRSFSENDLEITEFEIEAETTDKQTTLIVSAIALETERARQIDRILSENISALRLSYYGRLSSDQEARWHNTWQDPIYLPDLIKVEWEEDGKPVPPLTIQPGKTERQRTMSLSSLVPPA